MARANIDLGWLAGLLTGTPTAQTNPTFGAAQDPSFQGPVQPGQTPPLYTQNGTYVPPDSDTTHAFIPPSKWQTFIHPEAAQAINNLNNQAVAQPVLSRIAHTTQLGLGGSDASLMKDNGLLPQNLSSVDPRAAFLATGGDFQPTHTGTESRAISDNLAGVPSLQSGTDINTAKNILEQSNRALVRQPTVEAGQDVGAVNTLQGNILAHQQLVAELGREPSEEEVRDRTVQNQLKEQGTIVPSEQNLHLRQIGNASASAMQATKDLPYTLGAQHVGAVRNLAETERMPIPPRYSDIIDPMTDNITLSKDPIGANPFAVQMAGLSDGSLGGGQPQTIKDANGKTYTIPGNSLVTGKGYSPLGVSRPASTSGMSVGGGTNNVTNSVPHNVEGSMTPPVPPMSSSTTLKPANTSSMSLASSDDAGGSYLQRNAQRAEAEAQDKGKTFTASEQLHGILAKYDKTINPSGAFGNPTLDRQTATDWISNNANKMSKSELKQALSLMHQLPD